jgi:hypothetical protein
VRLMTAWIYSYIWLEPRGRGRGVFLSALQSIADYWIILLSHIHSSIQLSAVVVLYIHSISLASLFIHRQTLGLSTKTRVSDGATSVCIGSDHLRPATLESERSTWVNNNFVFVLKSTCSAQTPLSGYVVTLLSTSLHSTSFARLSDRTARALESSRA